MTICIIFKHKKLQLLKFYSGMHLEFLCNP